MGMDSMRELIDRVRQSDATSREALNRAAAGTSAPSVNALTFSVGDRVIDLATGLRGTVEGAERAFSGRQEIYMISLATGARVHRGPSELEADAPVAPVVK